MKFIVVVVFTLWSSSALADSLRVVSTFESAGLYWKATSGSSQLPCELRYRVEGDATWKKGFSLWFDQREHEKGGQYRGSLVHLAPGTRYEVEVSVGEEIARSTFSTWSEEFPVGTSQRMPENADETLVIRNSGSSTGWLVYEPGKNSVATIDVAHRRENCIRIENASHIILRGLTLRGASRHAIELVGDVHDIVIEDCEISDWGSIESDGWGRNPDSAVFSRSRTLERVVVQRNRIHHPHGDSNNWAEHRPTDRDPDNHHPGGPQVITFAQSRGNHVFRYNRVWSDDDHQFNDIFGASSNYSTVGFPNCDSDIYGNRLSHCWDDAIESEGANQNVRIWGNHIEKAFVAVATATTSIGPLYVWRNVVGETRQSDAGSSDEIKRGGFLKTSDRMGGGRIYVFHNTLLQPPAPPGSQNSLGCQIGLGHGGNMSNVVSRNNIFHTSAKGGPFNDRTADSQGDYDYDLYNGRLLISTQEQNGVVGVPVYSSAVRRGSDDCVLSLPFIPVLESPNVDAGVRLNNFNDDFVGRAPDIGAVEVSHSERTRELLPVAPKESIGGGTVVQFQFSDRIPDSELIHFHGDASTVKNAFARQDENVALVVVNFSGLSSAYSTPFAQNPELFQQLLDHSFALSGNQSDAWRRVFVSSFSAGYGAVREILASESGFRRIDGIVAADSIYAGLSETSPRRQVNTKHMEDFLRFASEAVAERKTFVITHSAQATPYASTTETADYLLGRLKIQRAPDANQISEQLRQSTRAGHGNFVVLGCDGTSGSDHLQHLFQIDSFWERLFSD